MSAAMPYRILVVDDEMRLRQVCRRVLEPEGFEVLEAADGREGLAAIAAHRPDLVLVDLMMPVMGGMELLAAARERFPDLAFVVITGYATLEKAVEAMKEGADDFLAKPFKPQELRLVVERVLRKVRTLQDMADEKSRNRVLVEAMTNGVLVVDAGGRVALMNPALRRLLGRAGEDPRGLELSAVLPCPEVVARLERVLAGGEPGPGPANCLLAPPRGEEATHLEVDCIPFLDGRGNLLGAVAICEDVTARRRLDALKDEYVSTVAHDIASPLSSVIAQLATLEGGLVGELNEKQRHLVERARLRVQGIVDLSKDLLDLARLDAGHAGSAEPVAPWGLLQEAVELNRPEAEAKGMALLLEPAAGELPRVAAAPRALAQVFNNLVSNAVRYTPAGGRVTVAARGEEGGLWVAVRDTGFGIAPEEQAKIFQRFYRVRDANTRAIVGTGLGLPIVKRVVEECGGRVELSSAPGRGSEFRVWLPAAPAAPAG